ncbi:hypothetical protein VTK73DRAFT_162 [Phialemonium thermophilum]|uniref:Heterokaryon incompatibility domain-containing protein n=1 Tax=Phialemonium thermophilum TaxID=223376 RepID=A0ABR3VWQ8_9PEZI
MWLLTRGENGEIALTEDRVGQIPDYAILSHTWGPNADEVTFADMREGTGRGKKGYGKIEFCAKQAARDGLHYFWVDTCCIDKSNKAELDEAINSMFQWYRNAARCYAYLTDVSTNPAQNNPPGTPWEQALLASRWFTRGWTLQELLAPASVAFFSQEHVRLGDKASLQRQIHKITRIPISALQTSSLSSFSLEERFSWAERRETTRPEDRAYCLLGIFGVFIPLIYGEGTENAMRRLKREIDETQKRQGNVTSHIWVFAFAKNLQYGCENSTPAPIETARTATRRGSKVRAGGSRAIPSSNIGNKARRRVCFGCPPTRAAESRCWRGIWRTTSCAARMRERRATSSSRRTLKTRDRR